MKALVISGGGAKFWHGAGALTALKAQGHEFDCVYGTSTGAICTLLWMQGDPARAWDMAEYVKPADIVKEAYSVTKLKRFVQAKPMVDNSPMQATLKKLFPRHTLDFSFKSHAVATNLITQRREVFTLSEADPDIYRYIVASSSIPALFAPVHFNDDLVCVDGGAIDNTLLEPAIKAGCTEITLILLTEQSAYKCNPDDVFDVISTLADGTLARQASQDLKLCAARNHMPGYSRIKVNLIRPKQKVPVELFKWSCEQARTAFDMGYTDALHMESIIDPDTNDPSSEGKGLPIIEGGSPS
jgi:predicted acylesterase/phospholipase RssA